jgi:DNA-binding SARP family transcriptional activator
MLRVRLLGGLEVEGTDAKALGSRKGRRLLALLAVRGAPVPADVAVEALWGDAPPSSPADQVAVLVSRLRNALGAERITRTDAGYVLHADWLDTAALHDLVTEAERRVHARGWPAARTAADAALALLRGPLLPEEDGDWCAAERARVDSLASRARHAAATAALAAGDLPAATATSGQALDADPFDEAALRLYLTACAAAGRPARALAAYEETRRLLRDELGTSPAPATEAAYAALLADRVPEGYAVGAAATTPTTHGTLPGRENELAALDRALEATTTQVVVVEGEPGIGKSRLLDAWAGRANATVLRARCDELGRAVPLQPLLDALAAYLAQTGDDAVLGDAAALLTPLLHGAGATVLTGEGPAQAVLHTALLGVVQRLPQPVALLLDDAHLMDNATAAWLALARRRATTALLVVAAQRPGEGRAVDATTTVALGPLDEDAAIAALGERAREVYARSGGNPLFLTELTAHDDDATVPDSLRAAVAERCDRAGADVAATLRAAAVLGPEVDLDLLCAVLGTPPDTTLDHLEEGARRRLLEERGATFAFRHALVREALAVTASASRRALLHREAARFLTGRNDAEPLAVAYHARIGGDRELAAAALARAADVATDRFDYDEAVRLLDEAVTLSDTPALRRQRAHALFRANRPVDAAADAEAALTREPTSASYELVALAAYVGPPRDFARAQALADEGARLATTPAEQAACLALGGHVALSVGDLDGAERRLTEVARLAEAPPAAAATAGVFRGAVAYLRGAYDDADRLLRARQRPPGEDQLFPAHLLQFRALALAGSGRPLDALEVLARQDVEVERLQLRRFSGRADNCRGYVLRGLGAFDAADDANRAGVELAAGVDQAEAQAHGWLDLAAGALLRGDPATAAEHLARTAPFVDVEHSMRWRHVLRRRLLLGRVALADGRPEDARAEAAAVLADATARGVRRYEVLARLLAAQAGEPAREDDVAALDEVAGLEAWWLTADLATATGNDAWRALAERRLAALVAQAGPYADALRTFGASRVD